MVFWPKLPKVIKTPLKDYTIVITDDFDDEETQGHTNHATGIIKIHKNWCLEYQWQTIYHEKVHIAEFITGMKPLKDKPSNSDAERLGMGLCMIDAMNGWIGK